MNPSSTAIIVLAAGESARMGRPKQLLIHQGKTLVRRAVETALSADSGPVVAVLGANEAAIREELADMPISICTNPDWAEGMASSIRTGLQAVPHASSAVFMLCDQPLLTAQLLKELIATHQSTGSAIVASHYSGSIGVPVLFDQSLFGELMLLRGPEGAKKVVQSHLAEAIAIPFPGGEMDIDTPEQYQKLTQ